MILFPALSFGEGDKRISEVKVLYKGRFETADNIRKVIDIHAGDELDQAKIDASKCLLGKSGLFSSIDIEPKAAPDGGVILIYRLAPKRFIRSIKIKDNFPVFESEIRRKITAKKGDEYEPIDIKEFCPVKEDPDEEPDEDEKKELSELEKQARRIEEYFEKEGFFGTLVEIEADSVDKFGDVNVIFRVHRGVKLKVDGPEFEGLTALSERKARRKVKGWGGRYREAKIKKGIERLEKKLHKEGYIEARVKIEKLEKKPEDRKVLIKVSVREGPRAKIRIRKARHFTNRTLKKHMPLYEDKYIDEFELETTDRELEKFYRSKGFKYAKVTHQALNEKDRKGEYLKIKFFVEEGKRVLVKDVKFEGNKAFKTKKLKKQMLTKKRRRLLLRGTYSEEVLQEDLEAIIAFYKKEGFRAATTEKPLIDFGRKGNKARITININEGPRTMVTDVRFEGETGELKVERKHLYRRLELKRGKPFNEELLLADKDAVLFAYADRGHPYAKASQNYTISPDRTGAVITYTITEGKFVKAGELLIRGNFLTTRKVLEREVRLKPGEDFKLSRIASSRRDLHRLGVMDSVRLETIGLENKEDTVHLLMGLEEKTPKALDIGMGFDSENGPQGNVEASHVNLFGWAKEGRVKLTGGRDLSRLDLRYIDPKIFGSKFRLEIRLYAAAEKREAFDQTLYGGRASVKWKVNKRVALTLATALDSNILYNVDPTREEEIDVDDNILYRIGPILNYDDRNDFINPTKGSLSVLKTEYIRDLLSNDHFIKGFLSESIYYTPGWRVTLAWGFKFGHIEPLDDSSVPIQEVFFVGGNNTVRGYSEDGLGPRSLQGDPLGGLEMGVFNFEIRFPIYKFIYGVLFYDAGVLADDVTDTEDINWGQGVGPGIRILTPLGPVRFDYGYKLEPSPFEDRDALHFSFAYPF